MTGFAAQRATVSYCMCYVWNWMWTSTNKFGFCIREDLHSCWSVSLLCIVVHVILV